MIHPRVFILVAGLLFLNAIPRTLAHGHGVDSGEGMKMGNATGSAPMGSYFTYPSMGGTMLGHIIVMTIAWFFMLPIGR